MPQGHLTTELLRSPHLTEVDAVVRPLQVVDFQDRFVEARSKAPGGHPILLRLDQGQIVGAAEPGEGDLRLALGQTTQGDGTAQLARCLRETRFVGHNGRNWGEKGGIFGDKVERFLGKRKSKGYE